MKKNLSWKFTLPIGVIMWLIGKFIFGGEGNVLGSAIQFLGFVVGILGLVGMLVAGFKSKA